MRTRVVVVATLLVLGGCVDVVPTAGPESGTQQDAMATTAPTAREGAGAGTETTTGPRPEATGGRAWTVTVVRVIDGDTMEIEYANGTRETIRLLGVDTPETRAAVSPGEWEGIPDTPAGRSWLRAWGENASGYAERRLAGREVRIVSDAAAGRRGGYGRLLVYLVTDGEVFGEQLLEGGYARLYETEFALYEAFAAAEARAHAADRGVWGFDGGAESGQREVLGP